MAASSFGSINIRVELDAATASGPQFERQSYVTTRHIPGSNSDVTQVMGYGTGVITLSLLVDATEWTALQSALLTTATLTIAGVSQGTCLLEGLSQPTRHVDGWVTVAATLRESS